MKNKGKEKAMLAAKTTGDGILSIICSCTDVGGVVDTIVDAFKSYREGCIKINARAFIDELYKKDPDKTNLNKAFQQLNRKNRSQDVEKMICKIIRDSDYEIEARYVARLLDAFGAELITDTQLIEYLEIVTSASHNDLLVLKDEWSKLDDHGLLITLSENRSFSRLEHQCIGRQVFPNHPEFDELDYNTYKVFEYDTYSQYFVNIINDFENTIKNNYDDMVALTNRKPSDVVNDLNDITIQTTL